MLKIVFFDNFVLINFQYFMIGVSGCLLRHGCVLTHTTYLGKKLFPIFLVSLNRGQNLLQNDTKTKFLFKGQQKLWPLN